MITITLNGIALTLNQVGLSATISVSSAKDKNGGTYCCTAINGVGQATPSYLQVRVGGKTNRYIFFEMNWAKLFM